MDDIMRFKNLFAVHKAETLRKTICIEGEIQCDTFAKKARGFF